MTHFSKDQHQQVHRCGLVWVAFSFSNLLDVYLRSGDDRCWSEHYSVSLTRVRSLRHAVVFIRFVVATFCLITMHSWQDTRLGWKGWTTVVVLFGGVIYKRLKDVLRQKAQESIYILSLGTA